MAEPVETQYVHIALIGAVSAGKSTLLNALFGQRYSNMAMARTTATEIIYLENPEVKADPVAIHDKNVSANAAIMTNSNRPGQELKVNDIAPLVYEVPVLHNFLVGKLNTGVRLALHDLPGLNCCRNKIVYRKYIESIFHTFDIILFVVDARSALNTVDEREILAMIISCIKNNKSIGLCTQLCVVINKCDITEMVSLESREVQPIEAELRTMITRIKNTILTSVPSELAWTPRFICICAEDAYVYRMYDRNPKCHIDDCHRDRIGINEFGRNWIKMDKTERSGKLEEGLTRIGKVAYAIDSSGFANLEFNLGQILTPYYQFTIFLDRLKHEANQIPLDSKTESKFLYVISILKKIDKKLSKLVHAFNHTDMDFYNSFFSEVTRRHVDQFILAHHKYVCRLDMPKENVSAYWELMRIHKVFINLNTSLPRWTGTIGQVSAKTISDNIDRFVTNLTQDKSIANVDMLISTIGQFIGEVAKKEAIAHICSNLCAYAFVREGKVADIIPMYERFAGMRATREPNVEINDLLSNFDIASRWASDTERDWQGMFILFSRYHLAEAFQYVGLGRRLLGIKVDVMRNVQPRQTASAKGTASAILLKEVFRRVVVSYPDGVGDLDELYKRLRLRGGPIGGPDLDSP